jgi:transcriptional regulator with XRE-family HTH domain
MEDIDANMTSEITLGQKIRELRETRGMSLRELATKADVSAPFLSDLEHGRRGTGKLDQIAKALGVPAAELENLKGTVSPEMKRWLQDNPSMVRLLAEIRASGKTAAELKAALSKSPRK